VILWDSLNEEDKAWCKERMVANTKWVVWKSKETAKGNQKQEDWLNATGTCIFQSKEEAKDISGKDGESAKESSRTVKTKGWWRRGDIQTGTNAKVMQCWIHKDAHTQLSSRIEAQQREPVMSQTVQALRMRGVMDGSRMNPILT
jgi:hypothetical protein